MRTAVLPDIHIPFHETSAVEQWIKRERPERVVLLGDVFDFHAITEHRKDPSWADRLDRELKTGMRWLQNLRTIAPKADITFIHGNHCARWSRYCESKAPALRNLKYMSLPEVLGLVDLGIKWHDVAVERKGVRVPCGQGKTVHCFHGHELKKASTLPGGTALYYAQAFGVNAHIGHTHKLALLATVSGGKSVFAVEGGHLGNPTSPAFTYAGPAPKSWQRAWAVYDSEQTTDPYPRFHLA